MAEESEDFRAVIERAQRVTPGDVASPFSSNDAFVNRRAGADLEYESHIRVFSMPADGADYEDVMNMVLAGEAIQRYEEKTFTKDGEFLVAFCYLTPRARRGPAVNVAAGDAEPEVRPLKQA